MSKPVLLILGAGPNIGHSVARKFAANGYQVALVSRTVKDTDPNEKEFVHLKGDLSQPDSVSAIFKEVRDRIGIPSVVVYNAAKNVITDPTKPFSLSPGLLNEHLAVNTVSVLAAIQAATEGFAELSTTTASRTFIYTGNKLNIQPRVPLLGLGVSKTATAHLIEYAADVGKDRGWKFYYADERQENGASAGQAIDGEAHADYYLELARHDSQGPWLQRFVKWKGFVEFQE